MAKFHLDMYWFRSSNHHIGLSLVLWVDEMFLFLPKSCTAVAVISAEVDIDHGLRTFGTPEGPGSPDDWLRTEDEHHCHAN